MHTLTKKIGLSYAIPTTSTTVADIKTILITRPNHRLGNLLLITPLLQEVISTFPQCKIDLFVKGNLAPALFRNYGNINQIIQLPRRPFKHLLKYTQGWLLIKNKRYDIVIDAAKSSSSGRLSVQVANAKYKVFGDRDVEIPLGTQDHEHIAKHPVYNFRHYLTKLGLKIDHKQIPSLDLKLSPLEIIQGKELLRKLVNNHSETICLFTYATGDKCYSESWWSKFTERLKIEYPNYNIIEVLPIENVSQLSFRFPWFYSKDVREIGSLIANTKVFVGADSGIMHLASSVQTPTIGLFSVTDHNIYGPYNNSSTAIKHNDSDIIDCLHQINRILKHELLKDSPAPLINLAQRSSEDK